MITAYFMAPVRGKDGDDVDYDVKWDNIHHALQIAGWLERQFPRIDWYIPHHNEILVEALLAIGVDSKTIVHAFSNIAAEKDFGVVYDGNGVSSGMEREIQAMRVPGKPIAYISTTSETAKEQIACVIAQVINVNAAIQPK